MTNVLVHVETLVGVPAGTAFELLALGRRLAGDAGRVEALVMADDPEAVTSELGAADQVVAVAHPALAHYLPEVHRDALVAAIETRQPDVVLLAYSTPGLDLAAAAAYATDRPLISYCSAAEVADGRVNAVSQLHGGKLEAEIEAELPVILAMNPGAYPEDAGRVPGAPPVESLTAPASADKARMRKVEEIVPDASDVDITQAERLVCVGRGIGDSDSIAEAQALAERLDAVIVGSRPVIDNGWLPKARQVGKSGHKVKPKLYLSLGVSGAPEHLEGMREADLIVAINTDAQAPIFAVAHYGAVCDLFDLMDALGERLDAAR